MKVFHLLTKGFQSNMFLEETNGTLLFGYTKGTQKPIGLKWPSGWIELIDLIDLFDWFDLFDWIGLIGWNCWNCWNWKKFTKVVFDLVRGNNKNNKKNKNKMNKKRIMAICWPRPSFQDWAMVKSGLLYLNLISTIITQNLYVRVVLLRCCDADSRNIIVGEIWNSKNWFILGFVKEFDNLLNTAEGSKYSGIQIYSNILAQIYSITNIFGNFPAQNIFGYSFRQLF